jgi:hypothetical protein
LEKYFEQIVDILIIEGKKILGDQVKTGILSFPNFIFSENYFLTTLDIWLIVQRFEIPTIFLCQKTILQTNYTNTAFIGFGDVLNDEFVFIVLPAFRAETIPKYKVIINNEQQIFFKIEILKEECHKIMIDLFENQFTIETYFENFIRPKKTTYVSKKPKLLKIQEQEEEKIEREIEEGETEILENKPKKKPRAKKVLKLQTLLPILNEDNEDIQNTNIEPKTNPKSEPKANKTKKMANPKQNTSQTKKNKKLVITGI